MDGNNLFYTHPSILRPSKYAGALWNNALLCNLLYPEYIFRKMSIEGLHVSIWHSMHSYWSSKMLQSMTLLVMHRYWPTYNMDSVFQIRPTPQTSQRTAIKDTWSEELLTVERGHPRQGRLKDYITNIKVGVYLFPKGDVISVAQFKYLCVFRLVTHGISRQCAHLPSVFHQNTFEITLQFGTGTT